MKMPRRQTADWLLICASILLCVIYACANHRHDEMIAQHERLCNNTKTEFGRMHMAKCMVRYSPKKFLIMMEFCKKKVFGHVKFDQVLVAFCDHEKATKVGEWHQCKADYARDKLKTSVHAMREEGSDTRKFIKLAMKCLSMDLKDYE